MPYNISTKYIFGGKKLEPVQILEAQLSELKRLNENLDQVINYQLVLSWNLQKVEKAQHLYFIVTVCKIACWVFLGLVVGSFILMRTAQFLSILKLIGL